MYVITDLPHELEKRNVDAVWLGLLYNDNTNIYYLTHFDSIDPVLAVGTADKTHLFLSETDLEQAAREVRTGVDVVRLGYARYSKIVADVLDAEGCKNIGLPPPAWALYRELKDAGLKTTLLIDNPVEACRATKEAGEIESLREAQLKAEWLAECTTSLIHEAGVSGRYLNIGVGEIKREIVKRANVKGYYFPFAHTFILSSGANTVLPHYFGMENDKLQSDEPIIIDMVPRSVRTRYCANITRTVVRGELTRELRNVYRTVLDVSGEIYDSLEPGVKIGEIYAKGVKALRAKKGYGLKHALGHGIGLEFHEEPRFAKGYRGNLKKGMVFTIEVGLYKNRGVRIGNMFTVGDKVDIVSNYRNEDVLDKISEAVFG